MKRVILTAALLGLFHFQNLALGIGMILVEDPTEWSRVNPDFSGREVWPHPEPPMHRFRPYAPLEIRSVDVRTRINDQIATTETDQEFYNPNSGRLEGTFVFPIPKGAHLDKFSVEIDGKQVEAELLASEKAARIYEDIVRRLRDPALLEYVGRDLIKVRIFPLEPRSTKRVRFSYSQLLTSDGGLVCYSLPISPVRFSCGPVKKMRASIEIQTTRPLKTLYSPSHRVEIKREGSNQATVICEGSQLQGEANFELYFAADKSPLGVHLLTHRRAGEDGYFVLLASPGMEVAPQQVLAKDVALVLDTSGSMAGKKLEQAKKALRFCVENLNESDRFEIIRFSTEVEPLFNHLVAASRPNRERAKDFVEGLKAIGGTAIDDALQRALELPNEAGSQEASRPEVSVRYLHLPREHRPFAIIFLTDGRPTIGVTDEDQIVKDVTGRPSGHGRIFSFGIGTDVNTHLLDKLAEQSRGFSQYVLPEEDLEVKVTSFFTKIKEPVLESPSLRFTGDVQVIATYPSPLPDLFKGAQLVVVGKYSGEGDAAAVIEGAMAGGNRRFAYDVHFPAESSESEFIPRLWATRRVGYLLEEIRLHGENQELREEVTELARKYGIITPYTSYLIVEDEQRRDVPEPMRSLPVLQKDHQARAEAARSWHQFIEDRSGDSGVASSLSGLALKSADAAAPATLGAEANFARRSGRTAGTAPNQAAATPGVELNSSVQSSQSFQFAGGKNFFRNGKQWVDSTLQRISNAKPVRIQFGSADYFALLEKHPQLAPWLALGANLQFSWNGNVYEIYE